ncbi:MAG: hypothetical protein JNJ73_00395 [Hyphomonadaceae bacterium]|nr:hypothetical protein [Hyphomonadaceae bacterium]
MVSGLLIIGAALAICAGGLGLLFGAGNLMKRLAGLVIAHAGAAFAVIAIGGRALEPVALALMAAMAAMLMLGTAAAVRIAEAYGSAEIDAIEAEDAREEEA